jgi:phosphatase NudJ
MAEQRWKPSVTVAAVVEERGRFLLVEEETSEGLRLNNPAGHLDCGESPLEAVVREALEETARHFKPQHFLGVYLSRFQRPATAEDVTYLRLAYAGSVGEPVPGRRLDNGIVRTLWMDLDELRASRARHRSTLVLRCIEDHLSGQHYPLDVVMPDATLYTPEIKRPG